MPYGNGTGPAGMGPMTGRAAGYCAGYSVPGYANPVSGGGFYGRGRGRGGGGGGRGIRNMFSAAGIPGWGRTNAGFPAYRGNAVPMPYAYSQPQMTPEEEIDALKNQAKYMQNDIKAVNDRIKELESSAVVKK